MARTVREVRESKGISIGELSRRTGLARMTVQSADRGEAVSLETLVKIARELEVKVAEIDSDAAKMLGGVA